MNILKVAVVLIIIVIVLVFTLRSRRSGGLGLAPVPEVNPEPLSPNQVIAECRKAGLSFVADQLERTMLRCFRLVPASPDEVTGPRRTQIGGLPDLPDPELWPTHQQKSLSFIAQVNLSELAHDAPESGLPTTGMLYFFYDAEQSTWGFDPNDKGSWRVLYTESLPPEPQEVAFPEDLPEHARYPRKVLKAVPDTSIPEPFGDGMEFDLSEKQQEFVLDLYGRYSEQGPPTHQLLGHPMPIQGDMQLECQLVTHGLYCGDQTGYGDPRARELQAEARDWQLLLQIDTDDEAQMMWGDVGRLYFWIRGDDLRGRDFDAVWMILQCY